MTRKVVFTCSLLCVWLRFSTSNAYPSNNDVILDVRGPDDDPDLNKNVSELILSKGYPVEEHSVVTTDGYVLGVQRIPGPKTNGARKAILLHHGLFSASNDWVMNFKNESLAFILADAGYDVWLGNARGNTYSRRHVTLKPNDKKFWKFSWDDIALNDLPATIDYILNVTGEKQLDYVGHSMGTTIAFALLSTSPEYNQKVRKVMALAPVATVTYITSAIRMLSPFAHDLELLLHLLGEFDFLPNNFVVKFLGDLFCGHKNLFPICEALIFMGGIETKQLNETRIPVYLHHFPAGTSTPTVVHYAQCQVAGKFQRFDYGKAENLKRYGRASPPEFRVENITTPIALFWSLNDQLGDPTDVALLAPRIKNLLDYYLVPFPEWTHIDFAIGIDANTYVYQHLLKLLQKP